MSRIPRMLVLDVLERDGGRCVIAGPRCMGAASVADHRAGRGAGGDPRGVLNDPANLVAACGFCNGDKEDASGQWLDELERRGLRVRRRGARSQQVLDRARLIPVEWPDGSWWLLDSEGGRVPCLSAIGDGRGAR